MSEYIPETEFEERVVQVNRVSKKTAGGNRIGFSVLVVVGDKNGRVGVGLGKAPGVRDAIGKGAEYARKHLIVVPMIDKTIPHEVFIKRGAAKVLLKPASKGTGVIAGGAVRAVVEAAGVKDILSKVLGTNNQASNVYATLEALKRLKRIEKPIGGHLVEARSKVDGGDSTKNPQDANNKKPAKKSENQSKDRPKISRRKKI